MTKKEFEKLLTSWEEAFLKTCDGDPETFVGATITMDAVLNALKFKNDEERDSFLSLVDTFKSTEDVKVMARKIFAKSQRPKWKTLTVRAFEEECGEDYFEVKYDANKVSEEQVFKDLDMASNYAIMSTCPDLEEAEDYDEHFEEMAEIRPDGNGLEAFTYYLEEIKGYKVKEITHYYDYEFEW